MTVDRSGAVVVKPIPFYPDYQANGGQLPGEVINQVQIPPAAILVTPVVTPGVTPTAAPTAPKEGFPTWAKVAVGIGALLLLTGGMRR